MTFRKRAAILASVFFTFSLICGSAQAWDAAEEIARLKKEVPAAESFGASTGSVIWQRANESKMLTDGSMENFRSVMIMIGEKVPADWKKLYFPTPAGGTLKVEEAAWYNPMTGMKEGSLPQRMENLEGSASAAAVVIPDEAAGRVAVVAVRETRAKRYGVDETVNMAGSLPIWEQNVSVEVPQGMEIFWSGRDIKDPVTSKTGSVTKYKWQVMNQLAWNGEGFVVNERPLLSFSSKKGLLSSLRKMQETEKEMPSLPMPIPAARGGALKAGTALIEWVNDPARTLAGFPAGWVRSPEQIPEKGPWTPWEKTLLLEKWLKKLGWETELWWSGKLPLDDETPASVTLFDMPVLELKAGNSARPSWFEAGAPFTAGRISSQIAGETLYSLNAKGEKETKTLPQGSPSENRLALLWKLKLTDQGKASGTLEVTATGGWSDIFSAGETPSVEGLSGFLVKKVNFAIPGMTLEPTDVKEITSGYKLEFKVSCAPGIVHNGSMLLRLPGGIPMRVSDMIGKEKKFTLRFPFIIDQKIRMSTPKGFRMLATPPLKQIGEGSGAVLNESITHWPKKAQLLADSTWIVKKRTVDDKVAPLLKEELAAALRWPVLDLPFRK